MLLHSHSTAFLLSCLVSCLQVSWPHAPSHSVHKLLATSLCVVGLVLAPHTDFHHCLAEVPVCWRSSHVCRRSLATPIWDISSGSSHLPTPSALLRASFLRLWHLSMTVSPPVAVLCTLTQQITSETSMCPLKDPTRQNKSGQTWPMDKTKNWLTTSEIKPRSCTVGNHCPSRRTPPNEPQDTVGRGGLPA